MTPKSISPLQSDLDLATTGKVLEKLQDEKDNEYNEKCGPKTEIKQITSSLEFDVLECISDHTDKDFSESQKLDAYKSEGESKRTSPKSISPLTTEMASELGLVTTEIEYDDVKSEKADSCKAKDENERDILKKTSPPPPHSTSESKESAIEKESKKDTNLQTEDEIETITPKSVSPLSMATKESISNAAENENYKLQSKKDEDHKPKVDPKSKIIDDSDPQTTCIAADLSSATELQKLSDSKSEDNTKSESPKSISPQPTSSILESSISTTEKECDKFQNGMGTGYKPIVATESGPPKSLDPLLPEASSITNGEVRETSSKSVLATDSTSELGLDVTKIDSKSDSTPPSTDVHPDKSEKIVITNGIAKIEQEAMEKADTESSEKKIMVIDKIKQFESESDAVKLSSDEKEIGDNQLRKSSGESQTKSSFVSEELTKSSIDVEKYTSKTLSEIESSSEDSVTVPSKTSPFDSSSCLSKGDGTDTLLKQSEKLTLTSEKTDYQHSDQSSVGIENVTSAVIEKTLDIKENKTAEESESTVPSKNFDTKLLDRVSTADDSNSNGDLRLNENIDSKAKDTSKKELVIDSTNNKVEETLTKTVEKTTNGDITTITSQSETALESSSEDLESTVHRMLVTRSSEDGGTETEICSSSVTKITSDSCDKQLGNVFHKSATEDDDVVFKTTSSSTSLTSETKEDSSKDTIRLTTVSETPITETTIISTKHILTNGQEKLDGVESTNQDIVKTITTTITKTFSDPPKTDVKMTEDYSLQKSDQKSESIEHESSSAFESSKSIKSSNEVISSCQSLKKEIADTVRSSTPGSDMASEREFEIGGPSTPHSDISSGQVSRAATHVWGESSEGRPDSRHYDSDEDIPCSPMSATSNIAQSPPQFDFDIHQHSKDVLHEDIFKSKASTIPSAMTSSLYGNLPEEDPLEECLKDKTQAGDTQMYSSLYVSKYDDDQDETLQSFSVQGKEQLETISSSKKEDIDFETAVKEHKVTRGEDLTTKYTNGKFHTKTEVNGKTTLDDKSGIESSKEPHLNGKSSQPDSLEYQESHSQFSVSSSSPQKTAVSSQVSEVQSTFSSSSTKPYSDEKKDPIEGWGKPLGLPPPPKNLIDSPLSRSTLTLVWNPADEWGIPLGLPSPAPPPVKKDTMNGEIDAEITSTSNKTTPKKVAKRNAENLKSASNTPVGKEASNKAKHPESPMKRASNKDNKSKPVNPVYMDLTYVPHHGNSHYTTVEFFRRVRARYYVFSGTEPSREVFNALLEAKQTWEDKDLEVTIIPTYDTDTLGYWVAENEDILAKHKIDLSPSASRCTINLQDHETSCSAYRLEF